MLAKELDLVVIFLYDMFILVVSTFHMCKSEGFYSTMAEIF